MNTEHEEWRTIDGYEFYDESRLGNEGGEWARQVREHGSVRGERSPFAKLTEEQARAIRSALAAGGSWRQLAARFCVSRSTIYAVGSGQNWGHLGGRVDRPSNPRRRQRAT